jgi:hypothetical protein
MLRFVDPWASSGERRIKAGDCCRLPLHFGRGADVCRHSWMVESFPLDRRMRHCVNVVRLADGLRRTIAAHWWHYFAEVY